MKITLAFVKKVLSIVDAGLVSGLGEQKPGKMCVEAAVAFAAGEEHNDNPACVHPDLADIKINLNDYNGWPSDKARAEGLRRLAIAQLGSNKKFDDVVFWKKFQEVALEYFAKDDPVKHIKTIAYHGYSEPQSSEYAVAEIADILGITAAKALPIIAEMFVQVLIQMKIPGTKFLHLTEKKAARRKRK